MEKKPHCGILDTKVLKVVRSVRDVPPAHFVLRIESFSLLSQLLRKTGVDKYETKEFEAGGYKWRLWLYPEGNKKCNAEGHISLYLAMSETKKLTLCNEVNVIFKFFVLDQIRDNYLTLEDVRERRFHALKTERGIPQLLLLSTFNDPSNGYLIDDCCVFGAEVSVIKCMAIGENLSMKNEPANATITWKIDNYSGLKDEYLYSEGFTVGGCQWKLKFYPRGNTLELKGKIPSLFLSIHDDVSNFCTGWKVYVEYTLAIKDQFNSNHHVRSGKTWLCSAVKNGGYAEFISLSDLINGKKGFLVNDTLVVEGKINFISVVNSFV